MMDLLSITGDVLFTAAVQTIKELVLAAIKAKTNLSSANLRSADLSYANLRSANLSYANLRYADLSYANLNSADLSYANLSYADLSYAINGDLVIARLQFIPEEGSFVGWKKCRNGVLVKLSIPASAKRSHGTERKCRASKVKVIEVIGADFGVSIHDGKTEYRKGQLIIPDAFDDDRWNVCAPGIHFYITRREAEEHS